VTTVAYVDDLLARPVSMRAMALLRVLVGPIAYAHVRPLATAAWDGQTYRDAFFQPYAAWYPDLPRPLYTAVLTLGLVATVAMTVGVRARAATVVVWAVVTYHLFLSSTHVHSNRAYLVIVLTALAITPCDRELSFDAWWRARRGGPARPTTAPGCPLWLLRFEVTVVYGASGLSKLLDGDWFSGTVTWHRIVRSRELLLSSPLPRWAVDMISDRSFQTFAAKAIIATELFIAVGLWSRRTRLAAVWVAVGFHVAIQLSASVEVFSYLAVAALVIWAVPSTRDRRLVVDAADRRQAALAGTVRAFDWLARFRVEDGPPGAPVTIVDRGGHVEQGAAAVALVASRLPLTAWFALPVRAVTRLVRRRRPLVPA